MHLEWIASDENVESNKFKSFRRRFVCSMFSRVAHLTKSIAKAFWVSVSFAFCTLCAPVEMVCDNGGLDTITSSEYLRYACSSFLSVCLFAAVSHFTSLFLFLLLLHFAYTSRQTFTSRLSEYVTKSNQKHKRKVKANVEWRETLTHTHTLAHGITGDKYFRHAIIIWFVHDRERHSNITHFQRYHMMIVEWKKKSREETVNAYTYSDHYYNL